MSQWAVSCLEPNDRGDPQRPDRGDTTVISRPGVAYTDIDAALDGWQNWAMITEDTVSLAEIRRRVHAAGLD